MCEDVQAPDLTMGARNTPFLKLSGVRWSSFARLETRGESGGVVECGLRDIINVAHRSPVCVLASVRQLDIYNGSCREDKQPSIHKSGSEMHSDEGREQTFDGDLTQK